MREKPVLNIENAGERLQEDFENGEFRAHLSRYLFAKRFLPSKGKILDCACGTGYGTPKLSDFPRRCAFGVDIEKNAVRFAKHRYTRPGVRFVHASALGLPFPKETFDAYCSFETIEHVRRPVRLLQEAHRILKPSGIFLLSTPNRIFWGTPSGGKPKNPHHIQEWSLPELLNLVFPFFHIESVFGQRVHSVLKFSPLYLFSKVRRILKQPDFVAWPHTERKSIQAENPRKPQPRNFFLVLRKRPCVLVEQRSREKRRHT